MAAGPTDEEPVDPSDELMFLCLGGGNEVGRSCHIIQYKGKTVMVRWKLAGPTQYALVLTDGNHRSLMPVNTQPTMAWPPCLSSTTSI